MSRFFWLLWTGLHAALGGPVQRRAAPEGQDPDPAQDAVYRLPVFQHAPRPLVARELFGPVPYRTLLPAGLKSLLLPPVEPEPGAPGPAGRAVEVRCSRDDIRVRVDRQRLRQWPLPALFRLGSCPASTTGPRFLLFHRRLTECDGQAKVVRGQLVYNFSLRYTPPPQGSVIRVLPLDLPVLCRYNRFHYSYQVGFKPQVQHRTFLKSIRSKVRFSLSVCNGQWEPLPPGHGFSLGEPVYFVAQTGALLAGERLYVDSCYVTSSREPTGTPRADVVTNYGCMMDSRRDGSSSRFLPAEGVVLKFSIDTFLFKAVSQVLYLHCSMSVGLSASYTAKSCSYNKTASRWEELEGRHSVCSCCESACTGKQDTTKNTVGSPGWFIVQEAEEKSEMTVEPLQSQEAGGWMGPEGKGGRRTQDKRLEKVQMEARWNIEGEQETPPAPQEETFVFPARQQEPISLQAKRAGGWSGGVAVGRAEHQPTDLEMEGVFMSDQTRAEEDAAAEPSEEVPGGKGSADGSPAGLGATAFAPPAPGAAVGSTNTSIHGCDENDPAAGAPATPPRRVTEMSRMEREGAGGAGRGAVRAEGSPYPTATSSTSSAGSVWSSGDEEQLLTNRRETSAAGDSQMDPPEFLVRKSGNGRQASDSVDVLLGSEQFTSDRLRGRSGDSGHDGGSQAKDDLLDGPLIRGLLLKRSPGPAPLRDPDFVSGIAEEEALHLGRLAETGDFSAAIQRLLRGSSAASEQLREDGAGRSAVAVATRLQASGSRRSGGRWAERGPERGLQTFRDGKN